MGEIVDEAKRLGVPLADLCETAGVSRSSFWRYRKGPPPQLAQVDKMRRSLLREDLRQRRAARQGDRK